MARRALVERKRLTLPLWNGQCISARAEAEDGQIIKDRLEVLLLAKPFRELCPRMRTPEPGLILEVR